VALDGDVKNSTYSEKFMKEFPGPFHGVLHCRTEHGRRGRRSWLGGQDSISPRAFACFLARAYDFVRMAGIGQANLKLCGSHAGISIGEDGPSQMGLEDIAMMRPIAGSTVLYPSDGVSAERLVELAAQTPGNRLPPDHSAERHAVLYSAEETFPVGGSKVLRSGRHDKVTLIGRRESRCTRALEAYEELRREGIEIAGHRPVQREAAGRRDSAPGRSARPGR
jgi:transketolase